MPRRAVLLIVLLVAALGHAPAATEEGSGILVATPWEVRRTASELLADLASRRDELPRLLDRAQRLLAEHGAAPVPYDDTWTPLSQAVAAELQRQGLAEAFRTAYAGAAQRDLEAALAQRPPDEDALIALARHYPGTPAATRAWRILADRAWDRGRLGSYLHRARMAGAGHEAERIRAARGMLVPQRDRSLPADLDELVEMWSIPDLPLTLRDDRLSHQRRGDDHRRQPVRFAFSAADRDVMASSDGRIAFVFDPLFGQRVGPIHDLVTQPAPGLEPTPVADGLGFVIPSLERGNGRPVLVAVGYDGAERWRADIDLTGVDGMSRPVLIDDTLAVALTIPTASGTEIRVLAVDRADGALRWNRLIAKDPRGIRHRFRRRYDGGTTPSCAVHAGALMVLTHAGMLAELGVDGRLRRVFSYPTTAAAAHLMDQQRERDGAILSDGHYLVATPADTAWVLMLGPDDEKIRRYAGLGAGDQLLDVLDGHALLAGTRVTSLALDTGTPAWSQVLGANVEASWGRLDRDRALVLVSKPELPGAQMQLIDREDGDRIATRRVDGDTSVAIADELLIRAGPDPSTEGNSRIVVGFGDERGFDRLQTRATAEPDNPRPLIGLASLYRARGDLPAAYDHLYRALELGAAPSMAEAAARIARRLTDLNLGGEGFAAAVARIEALEPHLAGITAEAQWWRGRHAELDGRDEAAARAYRAALAAGDGLIEFADGFAVDRRTLARLGLARLGRTPPPHWLPDDETIADPSAPETADWQRPQRFMTPPVLAEGLAVGYLGGRIRALALADGRTVWSRHAPAQEKAFLGVRQVGQDADGSVEIEVIPGSAAEAAGLRDGDRLIQVNGRDLDGFGSLVSAVVATEPEGRFSITVERQDDAGGIREHRLAGYLGHPMTQAVTAVAGLVLCRRMSRFDREDGGWRVAPDRDRDPSVEILDLTDGTVLWREELIAAGNRPPPPEPLLVEPGILVAVEGATLVGIDPRTGQRRWSLPEIGGTVDRLQSLGDDDLVLLTGAHGIARVIDPRRGTLLLQVPMRADAEVLVAAGDCYLRIPDGRLAAWDIGLGRQRWTRDDSTIETVMVVDDAVYVLDPERRLAVLDRHSGETRRTYGAWTTIHATLQTHEHLYLHARGDNGVDVIAAIDRATGATRWSHPLPPGLELRGQLQAAGTGVAAVLDHPDQAPGLLVLDAEGAVHMAHLLGEEERVRAGPGGVLATGPQGIRALPAIDPDAGAPLPCPRIPDDGPLSRIAARIAADGPWHTVGASAYSVARVGDDLVIVARIQPTSTGLDIHLADRDPDATTPPQSLILRHGRDAVFDRREGGWSRIASTPLPGPDQTWTIAVRLRPSPLRQPGTALLVRAAADGAVDGSAAPWWLRDTWRPVAW